jgi:two-component system sensor histidine kinase PilS (NtrC family)
MKGRWPDRARPAQASSDADSDELQDLAEQSWFGAEVDGDAGLPEAGTLGDPAETMAAGEPAQPGGARSRASALGRILRTFLAARAALSGALALTVAISGYLITWPSMWVWLVLSAYTASCIGLWVRPGALLRLRARRSGQGARLRAAGLSRLQWLSTIGVDTLSLSALYLLSPASAVNYLVLLLLPVLMAGVLTSRLLAFATSALASLVLLSIAVIRGLQAGDMTLLLAQAGLSGCGFFIAAFLVSELAARLASEERTARSSLELAQQQAQINRLVIEEMHDGVLVVDRHGRVRAANPAARRLIVGQGMAPLAPFQMRGIPAWAALVDTVEQAFAQGGWPEAGRDVQLILDHKRIRTLRVRIRFTRKEALAGRWADEDLCVLLMEDVLSMLARSRQERLAAMGRMSAGVAHEIRNPLAAITQANALLAEDEMSPQQARLIQMVGDNAQRLKRIVDDVMEVAAGNAADASVIDVGQVVRQVCLDWLQAQGLQGNSASPLELDLPAPHAPTLGAVFEIDHLRRVLVNLLDNAWRHGNRAAGSVRVRLGLGLSPLTSALPGHHGPVREPIQLIVASNGEPIDGEVERHLFEPFFSTRSRGTGLGLYICRELCERYRASIEYRLRPPGEPNRNEFIVSMALHHPPQLTPALKEAP